DREPQTRRRCHQSSRIHRRSQHTDERRAQSRHHALRRARTSCRIGIRNVHGRASAGSRSVIMRSLIPFHGVLLASVLALAGCSSAEESAPEPPTPVRVAEAVQGPAAPAIRTNGVLANKDEFRLSFKVGGVIQRIAVNEGDRVRKGQKLAEIEQTEIDAQVEQARQAYEKAKRDYERGERLYADQVISLEQLQDLKTQTAVAEAALKAAEFNRNYAAIIAPHDGTVLRRLAEERELVAAGAPILVLGAQAQGFVVRAGLADREIVQVKAGDVAKVRLDALPGQVLTGTLTEVASAADPASGLFNVEVTLEDVE